MVNYNSKDFKDGLSVGLTVGLQVEDGGCSGGSGVDIVTQGFSCIIVDVRVVKYEVYVVEV